ncbi:MAG: helix-hairpin-helix domain-containing protein [Oscillospiraceae bacterium]|nr:helix-hairpin-helix domain-containing protein [Oscillospiraceae bacterium]
MKSHLPYNLLLVVTLVAVGLMSVFNLTMRQSGFAVRVGYAIPEPPPAAAPPPPPVRAPAVLPGEEEPPPFPETAPAPAQPLSDPAYEGGWENGPDYIILAEFPLEINAATYDELLLIPRVGDVTAQRIIQYREYLGGYTHLSQLLDIVGIGAATFEHITAYLYLAEAESTAGEPGNEDDS